MFGINIHGEGILNLSLFTTVERPSFALVCLHSTTRTVLPFLNTFHYFTLFCYMRVDRVQIHGNIRTLIDILLRIYGVWYTKYFEISLTLLMRLDVVISIKFATKYARDTLIDISVFLTKNKICNLKDKTHFCR